MESVKDLLSDPLKGTRRAQGILCSLFREVLLWEKINIFKWNRLLRKYCEKPHNATDCDKGNLNKALKSDDLNWANFRKAMDFIGAVAVTLELKLHWSKDRVTSYLIVVDPVDSEKHPTLNHFPWQHNSLFDNCKPSSTLMSHLYRHILTEEGITADNWETLFEEYIKNPVNVVGQTPKEISGNVNTLKRSLLDDRMSWNVFRRGLLVLGPKAEEYTLTLKWTHDDSLKVRDSIHTVKVVDPYYVE